MLFVQVSVWKALYGVNDNFNASLSEVLTYTFLSSVLLLRLRLYPGQQIGKSVYTGTLGTDMLKPVSLMLLHTGNEAGRMAFSLVTYSLPVLFLAHLLYGILPPASPGALCAFLVTCLLGMVIFVLFNAIVGYSAFWLLNNWFMPWFERALIMLLGGTTVPIWFYPDGLEAVSRYLPFKYIGFVPISFYLNRIPPSQAGGQILVQLFWIGLLLAIERLVWRQAQKKITVQGG